MHADLKKIVVIAIGAITPLFFALPVYAIPILPSLLSPSEQKMRIIQSAASISQLFIANFLMLALFLMLFRRMNTKRMPLIILSPLIFAVFGAVFIATSSNPNYLNITNVIDVIVQVGPVLALLIPFSYIIVGGVRWVMVSKDEMKAKKAKEYVSLGAIGILAAVLSFVVLLAVAIFGVDSSHSL